MSNGAMSQDEINEIISGDTNTLKDMVEKSKYISKEEKEDYNLLLDVINASESKKPQGFNLENRELKYSAEQLNKITVIHEKLAALADNRIYEKTKCATYVNFASINQLTVDEFSRCLPNQTLLGFFSMEPLKGNCVIEIDTVTAFAVIDIIHGKALETTKSINRLNDDDKSIIKELFIGLLADMKEAWSEVIKINPKLLRIESNPKSIDIATPSEMSAIITLQTKIIEALSTNPIANGMINICLPYPVVEPVLRKY